MSYYLIKITVDSNLELYSSNLTILYFLKVE